MTLKEKTIKGLAWSGISQFIKQIAQFAITVIFARMLYPDDFGLFAMALVIVNFLAVLMEMGMDKALIQKQDIHDAHYSSVFWLTVFTGICCAIFLILLSPSITAFYRKPELKPMLMVMSVNFLFSSFVIVQQAIITKEMRFRELAIIDISAFVGSGIIGIYLANNKWGAWSLVYQLLSYTLVDGALLWIFSSWKPRFYFSISDIREVFHFSANLTGSNIVNYFARNIDKLLIGRFLGAQALGYYSLSYRLMLFPLQNISWVVGGVMFPVLSKIKDDLEKVRKAYLKITRAISLIAFPLLCGLFVIAPEFVRAVYGAKWEPAVILIRILCVAGIAQSVGTTIGNIILSQGKSSLQFKMQIYSAVSVFFSVLIGARWGINGVAVSYALQSLIWVVFTFYVTNRLIGLGHLDFYAQLVDVYFISLAMLGAMFLVKPFIVSSDFLKMTALVSIGFMAYLILCILKKEIIMDSKNALHFRILQ